MRQPSQVRNVAATWLRFVLMVTAGLFMSPFIVSTLGTSAFGVWVLVGSLTGTLGLFDLGIRSAVTRFVAFEHARNDHEAASRIASAAQSLFICAGALVLLTAFILASGMNHWFNVPQQYSVIAKIVLLIVAATVVLNIAIGLYSGILTARQRLDQIAYVDIVLELLRIVLVVAVLTLSGGLIGMALVGYLLWLLRYRYYQVLAARFYPELRIRMTWPRMTDIRTILSVSGYATLIFTSVVALSQASTLIIAALLPVKMVALYSIGATLPVYAMALSDPIAQTVQPRASRLDAFGDAEGLRQLILTTGRYSSLLLLPVIVTFIVRGHSFIDIWMGSEFRGPSGDVLAVLAVGLVFSTPRYIIQSSFIGTGRHATLAPWYIGEALVVAVLTYLLVPHFGIIGAAWSVVGMGVMISCVVLPWICRRKFGLGFRAIAWNLVVRPLLSVVPFAICSAYVDRAWAANNYPLFFAQVLACLPIAGGGVWLIGLTSRERLDIREAAKRLIASATRALASRFPQ